MENNGITITQKWKIPLKRVVCDLTQMMILYANLFFQIKKNISELNLNATKKQKLGILRSNIFIHLKQRKLNYHHRRTMLRLEQGVKEGIRTACQKQRSCSLERSWKNGTRIKAWVLLGKELEPTFINKLTVVVTSHGILFPYRKKIFWRTIKLCTKSYSIYQPI